MSELLELLRKKGRETPENLAKMLGVSEADVVRELEQLEADGIIRAYQAVVNEERLDHSLVTTVIEVKVTPESEGGFDRIAQRISQFPEVESLFLMLYFLLPLKPLKFHPYGFFLSLLHFHYFSAQYHGFRCHMLQQKYLYLQKMLMFSSSHIQLNAHLLFSLKVFC